MKVPTIGEARALLTEGGRLNPGPWVDHSLVAADIARAVAERHPNLDPDHAYLTALLHDIGRTRTGPGVPDVRHILDSYRMMMDRGYEDCARVCLTHSFPIKLGRRLRPPLGRPTD
jgi:putative nucleotidyltransferase with HDIG domain